jgi:hypothetical protein
LLQEFSCALTATGTKNTIKMTQNLKSAEFILTKAEMPLGPILNRKVGTAKSRLTASIPTADRHRARSFLKREFRQAIICLKPNDMQGGDGTAKTAEKNNSSKK